MADLEDAGLVAAPHTSAGRIPTAQGYRVFVDSLLEMRPLGEPQVEQLRRELPTEAATPALLGSASRCCPRSPVSSAWSAYPGTMNFRSGTSISLPSMPIACW